MYQRGGYWRKHLLPRAQEKQKGAESTETYNPESTASSSQHSDSEKGFLCSRCWKKQLQMDQLHLQDELLLPGRSSTVGEMLREQEADRKEQIPLHPGPLVPPIDRAYIVASGKTETWFVEYQPQQNKNIKHGRVGFQMRGNNLCGKGGIHKKRNLLKCGTGELENEIKQAKVRNMGQISHLLKIKL